MARDMERRLAELEALAGRSAKGHETGVVVADQRDLDTWRERAEGMARSGGGTAGGRGVLVTPIPSSTLSQWAAKAKNWFSGCGKK